MDISARNIAMAARAVYGRNSFRGSYLEFKDRYFEAAEGGLRPNAAVLKQVRFRVGNLFDSRATFGQEVYDILFCRNLLIYFNRELQDRALTGLKDLLAKDGLLLVGPAEAALLRLHGFISAEWPLAFAFLESEPVKTAALESFRRHFGADTNPEAQQEQACSSAPTDYQQGRPRAGPGQAA